MAQIPNSGNAMANAMADLLGDAHALNYFCHMNEEMGFIYFAAPAVANIRTIASLNLAVAESIGVPYSIEKLGQLYTRKANVVGNPKIVGFDLFGQMLDDVAVLKLTFLRDPVDRFAALYRNVFSANARYSPPRQKLFEYLGMPIEENLSMLDLAELVGEEAGLKEQLPQLRSQRQMTGFDLVDYSFIGRHETWQSDFARVSHDIFGRDVAQFDPIEAFNQDPEGVEMKGAVDAETNGILRLAYAEDYEMISEVDELFPNGFAQGHE